jgi:tetratricopeptide (TPR) repeat protein
MWQKNPRQLILLWSIVQIIAVAGCGGGEGGGKTRSLSNQFDDARKIVDPAERSESLLKVANGYLAAADSLGARNSLMLASEAADEISIKKKPAERAFTYIQLSAGWFQARQLEECEDCYKDAAKAIRKIELPVDKVDALIQLGLLKIQVDKKSDAKKHFKQALEETDTISDPLEQVRLLGMLAAGYTKLGDREAAKQTMGSAMRLAQAETNAGKKARLLARIGLEQVRVLEDKNVGLATIEQSRKLAGSIKNNPNRRANILIDIAETYKTLKDYTKARELLNEAETLCRGRSECKPAINRIAKLRRQM